MVAQPKFNLLKITARSMVTTELDATISSDKTPKEGLVYQYRHTCDSLLKIVTFYLTRYAYHVIV